MVTKAPHVWRWRAVAVWIVVFTVATGWSIRENRHLAHEGVVSKQALCSFKVDLAARVDSSEQFLKTHPDGAFGISVATIRNSIRNQQATVDSLSILHCRK